MLKNMDSETPRISVVENLLSFELTILVMALPYKSYGVLIGQVTVVIR